MQETPRSLRTYLLLVGVVQTATQGYQLGGGGTGGPYSRLAAVIGFPIGVAFLWVGWSFHALLSTAPQRIERVLIVGFGYSVLLATVVGFISSAAEGGGAVVSGAFGLLITLYLLRNVRRLARSLGSRDKESPGGE